MKVTLSGCLVLLVTFALAPISLFSQAAEINPYGGWYWSGTNASGPQRFLNNQLIGVRGGVYVTPGFEIGGNYSWSNKFQPNDTNGPANFAGDLGFPQNRIQAHIWEAEFTYNFGKRTVFGSSAIRPYITGGIGGLTTWVRNSGSFVLNVVPTTTPTGVPIFAPNDVITTGNTFLTFSYGGGVKAQRLWGPMGFFGDIRGRTIPNFFASATTRTELSAGLTFSWGER